MEQAKLEQQKEYRRRTDNSVTRRYEKTPKGLLMRTYRNMKSRIAGIQKKKAHLYQNLELLDKTAFYMWALSEAAFFNLYNAWVASGYDRKLSPSIDRIDSSKGYILENMRWLTHSENSRLGAINKAVIALKNGVEQDFECASDAARALGADVGHVLECCNGKRKTNAGYQFKYRP